MVEKKKKQKAPEAPKAPVGDAFTDDTNAIKAALEAPVAEDEDYEIFVSLADVPAKTLSDLVQVRSIKGSTGAFSVDVQDGTPFSVQLVDGDAYHTAGTGYDAKLVKGLPRYVWDNIIDASKYWLVKV